MKLTAKMLREGYATLRDQPPFSRWKLPPPDDVHFCTTIPRGLGGKSKRGYATAGLYQHIGSHRSHVISLAADKFESGRFRHNWQKTLAHEMVHLACFVATKHCGGGHGSQFKRRAKQVCKQFGYNLETF